VITPGTTFEARTDTAAATITVPNVIVAGVAAPCIIVRVANRDIGQSISGITWGTATFHRQAFIAGTASRAEFWYAVALTPGTNNLVITFTGATKAVAFATVSYGVDQTTPIGNAFTATGSSTSPAVNVTISNPVLSDVLVKDVLSCQWGSGQTITVGALQVQEGNDTTTGSPPGSNVQAGVSRELPTLNPTPMTWTISASAPWAIIGTYLRPAIFYASFAWTVSPFTMTLNARQTDAQLEARIRALESLLERHERKLRTRL